jgi:hypothetical protein
LRAWKGTKQPTSCAPDAAPAWLTKKRFNFYGGNRPPCPRFVTGAWPPALQDHTGSRANALIDAAVAELLTARIRTFASSSSRRRASQAEPVAGRARAFRGADLPSGRHRARQLKMVFPHVSDEFSLEPAFLETVFRDA